METVSNQILSNVSKVMQSNPRNQNECERESGQLGVICVNDKTHQDSHSTSHCETGSVGIFRWKVHQVKSS
jgi:hypothetical protein